MKIYILIFLSFAVSWPSLAGDVPLAAQYSRSDSIWRPGINEPPVSLNKAFELAAEIQKTHSGKFPWCLDNVYVPGYPCKGGTQYSDYQFKFSRLIRYEPTVQREECIVTVRMNTGKVSIGEIHPQK
ncbi:MAG: hypothetical protein K8R87_09460 [Verrucomicrobia bacterium]|nr:hypothetical protein [Verrucomicrobiota bacterium]